MSTALWVSTLPLSLASLPSGAAVALPSRARNGVSIEHHLSDIDGEAARHHRSTSMAAARQRVIITAPLRALKRPITLHRAVGGNRRR